MNRFPHLARFAWLSIGAAVLTIVLKLLAYAVTGSVGLLSDALESVVNLIAACLALAMLTLASRPADEEHTYGHYKAEYLSSGAEGAFIFIAAGVILWTAAERLLHPQSIEQVNLGVLISVAASIVNLIVARVLLRVGRRYRSITLEADAQHLMTDVWTSAGVVAGIVLVTLTGWAALDPLIAIVVALNILWSGYQLLRRSALGLLDTALPAEERQQIETILDHYRAMGLDFHAMRTREAGAHRFVSFHVLVPGSWTVQEGHQLLEEIEQLIRVALAPATVFTHLEPLDDPISWADVDLERDHEQERASG